MTTQLFLGIPSSITIQGSKIVTIDLLKDKFAAWALREGCSPGKELQPLIGFRWRNLKNFGADNALGDKGIVVHPALKIGQRCIVRHNPTAQIGLKTADQQKYAVVKTALDPFLMALHEATGLAVVVGKSMQDGGHMRSICF